MRRAFGGLAAAWVSTLLCSASAQSPDRGNLLPAPAARVPSAPTAAPAPPNPAPSLPDDAARTKARALGYAGVEAYAAGDYSEASAKLEESFQLLPVPSLGLWSARALVGLGRWVVAEQRYRAVAGLTIAPGDSPVQQKAKDEAQRERAELLRRIPSLKLRISGASADEVAVSVDGVARSSAELRTAILLDPGRHELVGVHGSERSQVVLSLAERAHEEIELRFSSPEPAAASTPSAAARPSEAALAEVVTPPLSSAEPRASAAPPAREAADPGSRQALRIGGWLGLGVGAAGLGTSLVSYLLAERQYDSFERRSWCANGGCSQAEVDTYNDLRDVHQLSLIAGGVVAVAGATVLVLTWSDASEQHEPQALRLELGPARAALSGVF